MSDGVAAEPTTRTGRLQRTGGYVAVCLLGVLIGLFSVFIANGGSLLAPTPPSPGYVLFDGVQVDFFYHNGTPQIFGPNEQQACRNCPFNLTGGTTFSMSNLLTLVFPANSTTTYTLNATSPIPFEEWECSWTGARPAGWPPTGCPFVTQWHQGSFSFQSGGGNSSETFPLTLSIPDPAPDLPGGFSLEMVFTVSVAAGDSPPT